MLAKLEGTIITHAMKFVSLDFKNFFCLVDRNPVFGKHGTL
jgi:hypothetical protein